MSKAGETATFTYNADGLRVKKVCTTTGTTDYTLHGKNLVHLSNGSNNLHFFYDAQNKPAVVVFNGTAYGYVHNLQGDIVAIVNNAGTKVVEYAYDAWGKPLSKTGSMASTLGTLNPFRYRGYEYDEETGLYYLRSRYYMPYVCRFVNADMIYADNLFEYCSNTPLLHSDPGGRYDRKLDALTDDIQRYLTSNEAEIIYCRSFGLVKGALYAFVANEGSKAADHYTNVFFGDGATNSDGTRANAFKHAYWNAYMTNILGYTISKGIADAHEEPFVSDLTLHAGIPNQEHSEMDFYNNEYGRQYGLKYSNSRLTQDQLAQIIYEYAMSELAYYRKEADGTIRDIVDARPAQFDLIMPIIN